MAEKGPAFSTVDFSIEIVIVIAFFFISTCVLGQSSLQQHELREPQTGRIISKPVMNTGDKTKSTPEDNGRRSFSGNDPEGDALGFTSMNGFATVDRFGASVSGAGDVNGDGFSDIIVGAAGNDAGGSNAGRAYLYFGGDNMNIGVDLVFTGESASSSFGTSVSSAGDVNGDGYDDVIVGAQGFSTSTGRAYIYFGGPAMNNVADVIMTGESTNNFFGKSVASAGDVNGDGYADVIVGATGVLTSTGRAYIYFGGMSMNNVADVTMTGVAINNFFGISVSSAGDMNGDGYDDVIAGASGYLTNTGRAYIYFGGAAMNNIADVTFTGEATGNLFGNSVSKANDVNSDGYGDVIAGAEGFSTSTGRAYVFFGGASVDNTADVTFTGEATGGSLGTSVASPGDVNGDGYSDLLVGADDFSSSTGRAYLYYGHAVMNNTADIIISGELSGISFGQSVASAGDINNDGYGDFIIGAPNFNSQTGKAYIYTNSLFGNDIADLTIKGENTNDNFGSVVSDAGDVNGDGYDDLIIGAPNFGTSNLGKAYVFFGGENVNTVPDLTMTFDTTTTSFANAVSSAGDVNADGYDDIIVGVKNFAPDGAALIYFGGSAMDNVPDLTLLGESLGDNFGTSVSGAGDVNRDGFDDVIVGDNLYGPNIGRAYIYFGGSAMNSTVDVTLSADDSSSFGAAVSDAGDVNRDGYADVLVGAPTNDAVASNAGRAYIFYGGASMNSFADVTMSGESSSDEFGDVLSVAGDFNKDGFDDIIVGGTFTIKAYLFLGGNTMNNSPDVIFTDSISPSRIGCAVSGAGDVNQDGFSDVIVGADNVNSFTGRTYLFFGSSSPDDQPDIIMEGDTISQYFGTSLSGAGDLNGDGFDDIASSAPLYNSNRGKTQIFLSSPPSVKPILNFVKDVPNDQGGKVNIKWARNSYDVTGRNSITGYAVFRSYPPVGGNFSWEEIATVTASRLPFYTFTAATPFDSTTNNSGNLFYKIRSRTSDPNVFWESAILSGKSIDNIAPLMVSPFSSAAVSNNVRLTWNRSTAPDLLNYVLYRSTSPAIDPNTEPVFATTTDSTYLDTSPLSGFYYYFIVAQDIHNNKSPVAVTESPNMTLNLTIFVEGFYSAGSNSQVSDTITVELRNASTPFAVADVAKAVMSASGSAMLKFVTAANGNFYIAVKHRNSIETWSASTITLSRTTPANYDMSSSSAQAFGSNMIQVDTSPLRFAVYGGDVNRDGTVDATDVSMIDNDAANFVSGYVVTDLTGDDFVDGTDFAIADNNAANFVSVIRP
jgi:hypothetical protein